MVLVLVAGVLLLAACGAFDAETGNPAGEVAAARVADEIIADTDPDFEAMATPSYWIDYGLAEYGETWVCWTIAETGSEDDFVLDYTPPGYTWRLGIVTNEGEHHLFVDPVMDDVFETGGYDQVIACKVRDVPETEEAWCSPGYWRQEHHLDSWEATGFVPEDLFFDAVGYYPTLSKSGVRNEATTDPTLWQVLQSPQWYGGAAFNAVGDLLSEAHPEVNFLGERIEDSCPLN